jgi:hypothetical protein
MSVLFISVKTEWQCLIIVVNKIYRVNHLYETSLEASGYKCRVI